MQDFEVADQSDERVGGGVIFGCGTRDAPDAIDAVGFDAGWVGSFGSRQRGCMLRSTGTGISQRSCWWRSRRHDGCLAAIKLFLLHQLLSNWFWTSSLAQAA
jgi:hypothetical protein